MKCYRTTREFVRAVCQETGQSRPKQTCYLVQDWQNAMKIQQSARASLHFNGTPRRQQCRNRGVSSSCAPTFNQRRTTGWLCCTAGLGSE